MPPSKVSDRKNSFTHRFITSFYEFFFLHNSYAVVWLFSLSQSPAFVKDSLHSYILQGLKDWDVPRLSIIIVKDGKPVVIKVMM